jgi:hypothetical protein
MDSPHVAPSLHHGIICRLIHGQPPPDPTPAVCRIHRRLMEDKKIRWDVDWINDFEVMLWCAHKKFDFSPTRLPSTSKGPTPTSHPIRPPNPLEYIVEEGETKYQGEKWSASWFVWKLFAIDSRPSLLWYLLNQAGIRSTSTPSEHHSL